MKAKRGRERDGVGDSRKTEGGRGELRERERLDRDIERHRERED